MFPDLPPWAWTAAGLLAIPVLIAVNGFFVAAEFALVAVRKTRVEELVNDNAPRAKALLAAVTNLNDSVAASQLGITLASLALGLASEPALADLLRPLLRAILPDAASGPLTRTVSIALTLGLVTYLHVVFGEQMPKLAALQNAEKMALRVAGPLAVFARLARPLIRVMNGTSTLILRRFGLDPDGAGHGHIHSVDELRLLVEDTAEAGQMEADQAEFVMNVFELADKTVRDVMVPWDKVAALEVNASADRVMEAVREGAHTRMPVYRDTTDDIVGIVNTKDLFHLLSLRGIVVLADATYPAQFLTPDAPVATALRLFKRSKRPMAVVRDADRKVLGLLTLEDVLEEIIGDIEDEHDDPVRRRAMAAKSVRRSEEKRRGGEGEKKRGREGERG